MTERPGGNKNKGAKKHLKTTPKIPEEGKKFNNYHRNKAARMLDTVRVAGREQGMTPEQVEAGLHNALDDNLLWMAQRLREDLEALKPHQRIQAFGMFLQFRIPMLGRLEHTGKDGAEMPQKIEIQIIRTPEDTAPEPVEVEIIE